MVRRVFFIRDEATGYAFRSNYRDKSVKAAGMRIISCSDAKNKLRSVIEQVAEDETAYLLSSPANAAHLAKSVAQARAGEARHRELIHVPDEDKPDV
jgi:hypothetical protein